MLYTPLDPELHKCFYHSASHFLVTRPRSLSFRSSRIYAMQFSNKFVSLTKALLCAVSMSHEHAVKAEQSKFVPTATSTVTSSLEASPTLSLQNSVDSADTASIESGQSESASSGWSASVERVSDGEICGFDVSDNTRLCPIEASVEVRRMLTLVYYGSSFEKASSSGPCHHIVVSLSRGRTYHFTNTIFQGPRGTTVHRRGDVQIWPVYRPLPGLRAVLSQ